MLRYPGLGNAQAPHGPNQSPMRQPLRALDYIELATSGAW